LFELQRRRRVKGIHDTAFFYQESVKGIESLAEKIVHEDK
jgi:hypothetical protein